MVYMVYVMPARSYHGTRAGATPRFFHSFAKNLENRQNIGRIIGHKAFFDVFLMAICGHLCGDALGAKRFLKNVRFGCRD